MYKVFFLFLFLFLVSCSGKMERSFFFNVPEVKPKKHDKARKEPQKPEHTCKDNVTWPYYYEPPFVSPYTPFDKNPPKK